MCTVHITWIESYTLTVVIERGGRSDQKTGAGAGNLNNFCLSYSPSI